MEIFESFGRQNGKTRRSLLNSHIMETPILVSDKMQAERLKVLATRLNITIPEPVIMKTLVKPIPCEFKGFKPGELLIDSINPGITGINRNFKTSGIYIINRNK